MSTSTDDILNLINSGGDPSAQMQDIGLQIALARALKNRDVSPVMSSGSATLPNISGIIGNGLDTRQASADEKRLMQERLQLEQAQTSHAANAVQPAIQRLSGVTAIDNLDNTPSTPIAGTNPANLNEFNLLQGATEGAPAIEQQDTLRKYALAKAVAQQKGQYGHAASVSDFQALMQRAESLGLKGEEVVQYAIDNIAQYQPHEIAGAMVAPPTRRYTSASDVHGGGGPAAAPPGPAMPPGPAAAPPAPVTANPPPARALPGAVAASRAPAGPGGGKGVVLSTLDEEAEAARVKAASKAEGEVSGKTETERFYSAPKAKAALNAMIATNNETIRKASEIRDDPQLGRVTGLWNLIPSMYGGGARNLDDAITTLKANIGFKALEEMRASSPTGGALGSISDREDQWLQNSIQSLAQSSGKEQYQYRLSLLVDHLKGMNDRLQQAYEADFGAAAPRVNRPTAVPVPAATTAPAAEAPTKKSIKVDMNGNIIG